MIDAILYWNQVSLDAAKTDFSSPDPSINPMPEQGGPTRTSRALAIVHLAMYDAYAKAVTPNLPTYLTYTATEKPIPGSDAQAAVASAACVALIAMFPRQATTFQNEHIKFAAMLSSGDPAVANGIAWGTFVANKMLAARKDDGSGVPDASYAPSPEPGQHRPDPMNPGQGYLGPLWGSVKPFAIANLNTQVPGLPPPALNSQKYADDYNEVLNKGRASGGTRTPAETTVGIYWAYDGPRNIGVPPRLYNQVVRAIAQAKGTTEKENAKLFAMVNAGMADAGIQAWSEKYRYNVWRPVLGIREADAGWGPTGGGDGNTGTTGDPYWIPLGAPSTNQPQKPAFTPPFPAYPSGHATFGTVALRIAELALNLPPTFKFKFVSDELDGIAVGATGVRARAERTLSIAQAIDENLSSRVYLGVHWRFDGEEGKKNGELIATKINTAFPAMA